MIRMSKQAIKNRDVLWLRKITKVLISSDMFDESKEQEKAKKEEKEEQIHNNNIVEDNQTHIDYRCCNLFEISKGNDEVNTVQCRKRKRIECSLKYVLI